jgi:hypothetical protein
MVMQSSSDVAPQLSVILPLVYERGLGIGSVLSWTRNQAANAAAYEIVVVIGDDAAIDLVDLKKHLRPWDQVVHMPTANFCELYDGGVVAARAPIIFLTEAHVAVPPGTADATLGWFREHDGPGFYTHGRWQGPNKIANLEHRMILQDLTRIESEDGWLRLSLRGSAIKRRIYLEMGGLGGQYGFFAETHLSARLWERNYRLARNPDITVWHIPDDNVSQHRVRIRSYVHAQTELRKTGEDRQFMRRYYGSPEPWNESLGARCAPVGHMSRGLLALGAKQKGDARRTLLFGAAAHVVKGARYRFLQPFLWGAVAELSLWLSTHDWERDRQLSHFRRFYTAMTAREYAQCARSAAAELDASHCSSTWVCPTDTDEPALFGFHQPESFDGRPFRWTDAAAAVLVPPSDVDMVCGIRLAGVRIPRLDELLVSLGKHRIADVTIDTASQLIQFRIPAQYSSASSRNWLILATVPWAAVRSTDRRKLGLPIESISLEPLARLSQTELASSPKIPALVSS